MPEISRRELAALIGSAATALAASKLSASKSGQSAASPRINPAQSVRQPNVIILLADDLGYGDLGCYGHPAIRTPNIDRLAREGQRWTSFYASAPMCGPSREALMTGRLPIRIHQTDKNAWLPMPDAELTIGELLKQQGYATAYVGKWGLGDAKFEYRGAHPNDQGFDYFYGLVGSNDAPTRPGWSRTYDNVKQAQDADFPISLYRQRDAIETPVHQATLTQRYTEQASDWVRNHLNQPFLLYLGYNAPHVPIFASDGFRDRSKAGLYGDVVEELDWSVGQILKALDESGQADNTLVIFSSDNGPWLTYHDLGGSAGPWRDGKMTGWEGAYRVPGIFRWPGKIKPAVIDGIGVNVDLISTIASITQARLPSDRPYDSIDLSRTLFSGKPSPRDEWIFYGPTGDIWAARVGRFKLVYESWDSTGVENNTAATTAATLWADRGYGNHIIHNPPALFDLSSDLRERYDIAAQRPEIVERIQDTVARWKEQFRAASPAVQHQK